MREHMVYVDFYDKYFACDTDKRMTDLHVFLIASCVAILRASTSFKNHVKDVDSSISMVAVPDLTIDNTLPDIYTPFFNIECETGFKHHYDDLIARIKLSKKTVIVVLPNEQIKKRYVKHCSVRVRRLRFCTVGELHDTVYQVFRSLGNKK